VSINPFDDDNGSFFVLVNDEEQFTAKPTALRVWTTSNRTGPTYGQSVCARGWEQRAGLSISKPWGFGESDGA
jgi:uncharacterized protein YbdZ (MbtH family)